MHSLADAAGLKTPGSCPRLPASSIAPRSPVIEREGGVYFSSSASMALASARASSFDLLLVDQ